MIAFAFVLGRNVSLLNATVSPPQFPSCADQTARGDWSTSDGGFHHIPGQEAPIEGDDDVYYLENTGGNFLQCLCPFDSNEGIQTVWWNISDDNLTQEEINELTSNGWFELNGADWNLLHDPFLAKNATYNCGDPEPTPTVTLTPTPTTTPMPTTTPTPGPTGKEPRCVNLEAKPEQGSAPLTVNFTAHVDNPGGGWKEFTFSFDDDSGGQPKTFTTTDRTAAHRYEKEGTFIATVIAKAENGQSYGGDDCMKFIKVTDSQVLGDEDDKELPATGANLVVILIGLITTGSLGMYLYRRFRLA